MEDAAWWLIASTVLVCIFILWDAYVDQPIYEPPDADEVDRMIDLGGHPGSYEP